MRHHRRFASSLLLAVTVACTPSGRDAAPREQGGSGLRATLDAIALASGDTVWQRRYHDLVRRSRLVPIDSTARLLAAIPHTPDSTLHVIRQAIGCQGMILARAHGTAAWQRAYDRMIDSLTRKGVPLETEVPRMEAAPGPPLEFGGPGRCGEDMSVPPIADSLAREPLPGPGKH